MVDGTHVCGCELLLCANDGAASLCGVQGAFASDNRLALRATRASCLASDLGDGVPLTHFGGMWLVWCLVDGLRILVCGELLKELEVVMCEVGGL